jgi:hypothetical protein
MDKLDLIILLITLVNFLLLHPYKINKILFSINEANEEYKVKYD